MTIIFKPILPKPVNKEAMMAVLEREMKAYIPKIRKDFWDTVSGWKRAKPNFPSDFQSVPNQMTSTIYITGSKKSQDIWNYLDKGTPPHKILPKRKGMLRFKSGGYIAGSTPGVIKSNPSTPASGPYISSKGVNHPGFPARKWRDLIEKKHERLFQEWMRSAIDKAAKASGHSMNRRSI